MLKDIEYTQSICIQNVRHNKNYHIRPLKVCYTNIHWKHFWNKYSIKDISGKYCKSLLKQRGSSKTDSRFFDYPSESGGVYVPCSWIWAGLELFGSIEYGRSHMWLLRLLKSCTLVVILGENFFKKRRQCSFFLALLMLRMYNGESIVSSVDGAGKTG